MFPVEGIDTYRQLSIFTSGLRLQSPHSFVNLCNNLASST